MTGNAPVNRPFLFAAIKHGIRGPDTDYIAVSGLLSFRLYLRMQGHEILRPWLVMATLYGNDIQGQGRLQSWLSRD